VWIKRVRTRATNWKLKGIWEKKNSKDLREILWIFRKITRIYEVVMVETIVYVII
jgi:hypothetical protein